MSRSRVPSLVFGAMLLAGSAVAQARPGIAVLPFDDGGSYGQDKENFAALQVGIQASVMSELARGDGVAVVERGAVQTALRQQELGVRGRVDAATAAKVGQLTGARYAVFGNFIDLYGRVRLNARIVDVRSGEILKVVSNDDPRLQDRRDFYGIISAVAARIRADVGAPAAAGATPAIPTDALTFYSLGVLSQDRGERTKAAEYFRKAVAAYPDYTEAKEGLRRAGA